MAYGELIEYQKFRRWLESQDSGAIVGKRSNLTCCPLSQFLVHLYPDAYDYEVLEEEIRACFTSPGYPEEYVVQISPKWASNFVELIDGEAFRNPHIRDSQQVTAREALQCLEEALEEENAA